jgi:hypothetical protein
MQFGSDSQPIQLVECYLREFGAFNRTFIVVTKNDVEDLITPTEFITTSIPVEWSKALEVDAVRNNSDLRPVNKEG